MSKKVEIGGDRKVDGFLDSDDTPEIAVLCPPHPQHGGDHAHEILVSLSKELNNSSISTLRIDYGPWDEGEGELEDIENAIDWCNKGFERVGLFGYSFGATLGIAAASEKEIDAASVLGPSHHATEYLKDMNPALQIIYGEKDETVEWRPVVDKAEKLGIDLVKLDDDHFFEESREEVMDQTTDFLAENL